MMMMNMNGNNNKNNSNNHHHHQRFHSLGAVPFSWEKQPGVSKVTPQPESSPKPAPKLKLRTPPLRGHSPELSVPGIYIPLPPCPFQSMENRQQSVRWDDDPFLAAYMKCTKSGKPEEGRRHGWSSWKDGFGISCKRGCSVRDDSVVLLSRVKNLHGRKSGFSCKELKDWDVNGLIRRRSSYCVEEIKEDWDGTRSSSSFAPVLHGRMRRRRRRSFADEDLEDWDLPRPSSFIL